MAKPKRPQHGAQQNGHRPGAAGATSTPRATGQTGQARATGYSVQRAPAKTGESAQQVRPAGSAATTAARTSAARADRPANGTTETSASNRYRPLASREHQQARGAQRRKAAQEPWWQKNMTTLIAVGSVVVLVAIFVGIAHFASGGTTTSSDIGSPASAQVLQPLEHPDPSLFAKVGSGGLKNPMHRVNGSSGNGGDFLKGPDGKPELLYAGAEYCPYCAAERWSMIMALSRFGSLDGLKLMQSGDAPEVFPDTATFTFVNATYKSDYIYFSSVEEQDRTDNALQTPTAQQTQIVNKYDTDQYVGQGSGGGIPFLSFANQYVTNGAGYTPGALDNKNWQQISQALGDPNNNITQDIVGNANWITAAICQTTNQSPASVCKAAPIPDLEKQL